MKHTYIIAEAGVNHNGSLEMAKRLIDVAAEAGVDAVKFQTFKSEKLVSVSAPKAEYQKAATTLQETQFEMLLKLELSEEAHFILKSHCQQKGIEFLSTPFDTDSLGFLVEQLHIPSIKMGSGEITNAPLLLAAARTGKPILLSTGMSSLADIEAALGVLAFGYTIPHAAPTVTAFELAYASSVGRQALREKVTLLHCTTEYPAPFAEVNLLVMDTLRQAFELPIGFSDHTPGIAVAIAAVARKAVVIEKHITLDRGLPGPDHQASLTPEELKQMVSSIRQVEAALGTATKIPTRSELKNKAISRKSVVAARNITMGELFSEENLAVKRPGDGVTPFYYWDLLGQAANKEYLQDEKVVTWINR